MHCAVARSDSFVTFFLINVLIVLGRMNCELLADVLVAASWNILSADWHNLRKVFEFFVENSVPEKNVCLTLIRIGTSVIFVCVHRNNFCLFIIFVCVYKTILITECTDQIYLQGDSFCFIILISVSLTKIMVVVLSRSPLLHCLSEISSSPIMFSNSFLTYMQTHT
jgi:hypothetical protein